MCDTSNLCLCSVLLKGVRSFYSYVPSSFDESGKSPDGRGGSSIPVDSIHECVGVLLVRLILKT